MARPRRSRDSSVLSPLEIYLREINETPLLTAAEEKELSRGSKPATLRPATIWSVPTCAWW